MDDGDADDQERIERISNQRRPRAFGSEEGAPGGINTGRRDISTLPLTCLKFPLLLLDLISESDED